ncbi:hypothetical protein SDC9_152126 [bioreactor metagenome]|uniref:Uncharacterized protein n=1 Tax=bioreactor metagenome TaxID=1076179 RepID=A0A645ES80_9ZZZZ
MLIEILVHLDGAGVQTGLVGERGMPDIGLPGEVRLVGNVGDRVTGVGEFGELAIGQQRPAVLQLKIGDQRRQIHVSGAFPVAVDGSLDVHHARVHGGQ